MHKQGFVYAEMRARGVGYLCRNIAWVLTKFCESAVASNHVSVLRNECSGWLSRPGIPPLGRVTRCMLSNDVR